MKLKHCKALAALVFLVVQSHVIHIWMVVPVMNYIAYSGTVKPQDMRSPAMWRWLADPLVEIVLILLSLLSVVLAIAGLRRERTEEAAWKTLAGLCVFLVVEACIFMVWMQRQNAVYAGLGVK